MSLGLRDLNSARLKITERYLLNCDEIFAVCYIGRATTDAGVMGVFDLAQRADLSNIGIICTKSDVSAEAPWWCPGSAALVKSTRSRPADIHRTFERMKPSEIGRGEPQRPSKGWLQPSQRIGETLR